RIPGAYGGAAVDAAQRGGRIALDEDPVADRIGPAHAQADRVRQVARHPVAAQVQRLDVGLLQLRLAAVLLADQRLDHRRIDVEQRTQRADIHDVLEQLALARVVPGG